MLFRSGKLNIAELPELRRNLYNLAQNSLRLPDDMVQLQRGGNHSTQTLLMYSCTYLLIELDSKLLNHSAFQTHVNMNHNDDIPSEKQRQHNDVSDGGGRRSSASSRNEMMSGGEGNNNGSSFSNNTSDENITADASSSTVRRDNNILDCIPPHVQRRSSLRSSLRRSSFNTSDSISVGRLESGLDDDDVRKQSSVRFTEDTSQERLGGSGSII